MMISSESRRLRFVFRFLTSLMILLVFMPLFPAYALDSNYVISEYNGWTDIDERIDYEKRSVGFDGFSKRIVDSENGCFYMYFSFYDTALDGYDDDNIVISFDVWNDINSYHFFVNRNGFVNTGDDEQNNIRIAYNFDNCSGSRCGGEVLIAFELINNADRERYNHIRCEYARGSVRTAVLFSDSGLDMRTETTSAAISSELSGADKSTTSVKSSPHTSTDVQNSSEAKEKSTKYTPTGTLNKSGNKEQNSKFSAGEVHSSDIADTDNNNDEKTISNAAESSVGTYRMSKTSVIILSLAGVMIIIGIGFIIAGAAIKNKRSETDEKSDFSDD